MAKTLIAILGAGKGTWGHIARLISENEWGRIVLIGNEWAKENYTPGKEVDWVLVNNRSGFDIMKDAIKEGLVNEEEVAVSIISGSGKEHIALLAALKELGKDYELVILTQEGMKGF